jgi:hypothetical protein
LHRVLPRTAPELQNNLAVASSLLPFGQGEVDKGSADRGGACVGGGRGETPRPGKRRMGKKKATVLMWGSTCTVCIGADVVGMQGPEASMPCRRVELF